MRKALGPYWARGVPNIVSKDLQMFSGSQTFQRDLQKISKCYECNSFKKLF